MRIIIDDAIVHLGPGPQVARIIIDDHILDIIIVLVPVLDRLDRLAVLNNIPDLQIEEDQQL